MYLVLVLLMKSYSFNISDIWKLHIHVLLLMQAFGLSFQCFLLCYQSVVSSHYLSSGLYVNNSISARWVHVIPTTLILTASYFTLSTRLICCHLELFILAWWYVFLLSISTGSGEYSFFMMAFFLLLSRTLTKMFLFLEFRLKINHNIENYLNSQKMTNVPTQIYNYVENACRCKCSFSHIAYLYVTTHSRIIL